MGKYRKWNDEKIIASMLSHSSIKGVAEECGISEKTIYNKLKEPEFKTKYDKARMELLENHTHTLQKQIGMAIYQMGTIVKDPEASPQVRLNAADCIIRNSLKLTEQVDILKRLDSLEKIVEEEDQYRKYK